MKIINYIIAGVFGLGIVSNVSAAEPYVVSTGGEVVMTSSGACVRIGFWTPALASKSKFVAVCDPDLAPKLKVVSYFTNTLFAFDSATLANSGRNTLKDVVDVLKNARSARVEVIGHTDNIGKDKYNIELSEKRAYVVAEYLSSLGIRTDVVRYRGVGSSEMLVSCPSNGNMFDRIVCNVPNRRATINITGITY